MNLAVYDLAGRRVATVLERERLGSGMHQLEFGGSNLASGVYLCRMQVGNRVQTAKLVHFR